MAEPVDPDFVLPAVGDTVAIGIVVCVTCQTDTSSVDEDLEGSAARDAVLEGWVPAGSWWAVDKNAPSVQISGISSNASADTVYSG